MILNICDLMVKKNIFNMFNFVFYIIYSLNRHAYSCRFLKKLKKSKIEINQNLSIAFEKYF